MSNKQPTLLFPRCLVNAPNGSLLEGKGNNKNQNVEEKGKKTAWVTNWHEICRDMGE
jgi:hypothetical protein